MCHLHAAGDTIHALPALCQSGSISVWHGRWWVTSSAQRSMAVFQCPLRRSARMRPHPAAMHASEAVLRGGIRPQHTLAGMGQR